MIVPHTLPIARTPEASATFKASSSNGRAYLTLDDVVARYGGAYSAWTIREKARRGELPHLKHPGSKVVLFREDWLDAWDEGCELERRIVRQRGLAAGRVIKPKESPRGVPARAPALRARSRRR